MSDYKNLSKKLLEDKELTYIDYFDLLNDKNFYQSYYDEYFKKYLELDRQNTYLLSFLFVSILLNIGLLIVLRVG